MATLNKDFINKNLFKLLDSSGLTDVAFANVLNLSTRQIIRIRNREAEFSINDINKSCDFFGQSLQEINNREITPDTLFREHLMNIHKDNTEYYAIIEKRPSITYAINYVLLRDTNFANEKLTVKDIKEIFKSKGWQFSSPYISLALRRNKERISIEPHPFKNNMFLYSAKKRPY